MRNRMAFRAAMVVIICIVLAGCKTADYIGQTIGDSISKTGSGGTDVTGFDIKGLKLGMDSERAIQIMKQEFPNGRLGVRTKRGAVFRADLSMKGGDAWKEPYPEHIYFAFITQKYENGEEITLQFEAVEDLPNNPDRSVVYRIFLVHKIIGGDVATTNAYKQTAFEKYGRPDYRYERTRAYEYDWGIPVNDGKRSNDYGANPYIRLKAKLGNRYGEVIISLRQGVRYYQQYKKVREDFIRNIRLRNPNVDF